MKINRAKVKYLIIVWVLFMSCKDDRCVIFNNIDSESSLINFKKEEYKLDIGNNIKFNSYSFKFNSNKKIHGYFGKISDTIYFVNPLFNDAECIVKFPILILNNKNEKIITEPSSNCYDIPLLVPSYNIEILDVNNSVYTLKHTINEIPEDVQLGSNKDYCLFKISLEYGILEFTYKHYKGNNRVPWCFSNSLKVFEGFHGSN